MPYSICQVLRCHCREPMMQGSTCHDRITSSFILLNHSKRKKGSSSVRKRKLRIPGPTVTVRLQVVFNVLHTDLAFFSHRAYVTYCLDGIQGSLVFVSVRRPLNSSSPLVGSKQSNREAAPISIPTSFPKSRNLEMIHLSINSFHGMFQC